MLKAYELANMPTPPNRALARLRALVGRLRGRPIPILEETHA